METLAKKLRQGSLLQLLLLHCLYSQKGSGNILFQGGTSLRWVYGEPRASEDLDFVSSLPKEQLRKILHQSFRQVQPLCLSQFGPGSFEEQPLRSSEGSLRTYAIFRPKAQRERIAVRIEIEELRPDYSPAHRRVVLMDLPSVFKEMREGILTIPYSSSIVSVETPEEILTDKLRALFERPYLKGRDLFDLWFLHNMLNTQVNLSDLGQKLKSYVRPFRPARKAAFFLKKENGRLLRQALETDLRPFLPSAVYVERERSGFAKILGVIEEILQPLVKEGLDELIASHG